MSEAETHLARPTAALHLLQRAALAPAVRKIASSEDECVALCVDHCGTVKRREYFEWVLDGQDGGRAYVFLEC